MPRLKALEPNEAPGKAKELLESFIARHKRASNMLRTMAHSPATLEAYLAFSGAMAKNSLPARLREELSLAIGEANRCEYCVSAHTLLSKGAGLQPPQIESARTGDSSDPKERAALAFALKLVKRRGEAAEADVAALREAGYTDENIADITACVALNIFTNYFNRVADTEVDFPKVALKAAS